MTAFDDVNVWSLMMDVVEVVRPSMVCRGCCWHLSPASSTTGRVLRRLKVDAMV